MGSLWHDILCSDNRGFIDLRQFRLKTLEDIEHILETYTIEDILELNDLSPSDVLYYLSETDYIELPTPEPV